MFEVPDKYYVVAIEKSDKHPEGQTVFYAIDQQSGGYPYWSNWMNSAEAFADIEKASRAFDEASGGSSYLSRNVSHVRLVKAVTTLTPVKDEDIKRKKREAALSKLTDEEKALLGVGGVA